MKSSKETKENRVSIPEGPFSDIDAVQKALDLCRNYKGSNPKVLRAMRDFHKAREQSLADSIANIKFSGRFNADDWNSSSSSKEAST